jgi:hypothetical protein
MAKFPTYKEMAKEVAEKALDEYIYKDKTLREWINILARTQWIPVSERLPKDRDWYLGIFKEPDTGWVNPIPFICDYVGSKSKATTKEYWILRGFTDRDEHIDYYFNLECVAWRELPEQRK